MRIPRQRTGHWTIATSRTAWLPIGKVKSAPRRKKMPDGSKEAKRSSSATGTKETGQRKKDSEDLTLFGRGFRSSDLRSTPVVLKPLPNGGFSIEIPSVVLRQ